MNDSSKPGHPSTSTASASDSTTPKAPVDHTAMWREALQNPAHQAGVQSNQQGRTV